jgi:hypothetical protein
MLFASEKPTKKIAFDDAWVDYSAYFQRDKGQLQSAVNPINGRIASGQKNNGVNKG